MQTMGRRPALVLTAVVVLGMACGKPDVPPPLTTEALLGPWAGTMTHEGESQPLALEGFPPSPSGDLSAFPVPGQECRRLSLQPRSAQSRVDLQPTHAGDDRQVGKIAL